MPAAYTAPTGAALNTRGEVTGTQTDVLGTSNMLWTAHYYDNWGRSLESYAQHYLGGTISASNYDAVTTTYNFSNQPTTVTRKHWTSASTSYPLVTVYNKYLYDQVGRKLKTWEQLTNTNLTADTLRLISQTNYNEIGQIWQKQLASKDSVNFLQNIAYTYNERGWLTSSTAPLFQMQMQYNANPLGLTISPRYNGDIASQSYGTQAAPNTSYFTYNYDKINRLLSGNNTSGNSENNITYDQEGNIASLNRYSAGTLTDQLSYSYTVSSAPTNQLQSVADATSSNSGLPAGTTSYTYDPNGNMLSATNTVNTTGNKSFTYNLLNLPATSTFSTGSATFAYDAAGNKLRKASTVSGTTTYTDYIAGIQHSGTSSESIQYIMTEEGQAAPNGTTNYDYQYFLGDNLGNTRVSFGTKPGVAVKYQKDDYYPFGMEISDTVSSPKNYYLYNKKDLQSEFAEYDYGARFYDPVIGRFNTIDPLAEKSRRYSTYTYVSDNPISRIDPDGMTDYSIDKKTGEVKQQGKANNDPDRVVKTDKNGNVKTKGQGLFGFLVSAAHKNDPRVAIGGIEKGILQGGENLRTHDNVISVGGQGQPTVQGLKNFAMDLSEYLGNEIKGFSYSSNGSGNVTDMELGGYGRNDLTHSFASLSELQKKYGDNFSFNNVVQQFHTHPDGKLGATESDPQLSDDVTNLHNDKRFIPNASFIILYRTTPGQTPPAEYPYTDK